MWVLEMQRGSHQALSPVLTELLHVSGDLAEAHRAAKHFSAFTKNLGTSVGVLNIDFLLLLAM